MEMVPSGSGSPSNSLPQADITEGYVYQSTTVPICFRLYSVYPYKWAFSIAGSDIVLMLIVIIYFFADFDTNYQILFWFSLILLIMTILAIFAIKKPYKDYWMYILKAYAIYRSIFYIYVLVFSALLLFVLSTLSQDKLTQFTTQTRVLTSLIFAASILNLPSAYILYKCYGGIKNDKLVRDFPLTNIRDVVLLKKDESPEHHDVVLQGDNGTNPDRDGHRAIPVNSKSNSNSEHDIPAPHQISNNEGQGDLDGVELDMNIYQIPSQIKPSDDEH